MSCHSGRLWWQSICVHWHGESFAGTQSTNGNKTHAMNVSSQAVGCRMIADVLSPMLHYLHHHGSSHQLLQVGAMVIYILDALQHREAALLAVWLCLGLMNMSFGLTVVLFTKNTTILTSILTAVMNGITLFMTGKKAPPKIAIGNKNDWVISAWVISPAMTAPSTLHPCIGNSFCNPLHICGNPHLAAACSSFVLLMCTRYSACLLACWAVRSAEVEALNKIHY